MDGKEIFSRNLQRYMELNNKTRNDVCAALGVSYFTLTSWVNGTKYPRMDKVEMLANYFGIKKSDLIEKEMTVEDEKSNEIIADLIVMLRTDREFLEMVDRLYKLDTEKRKLVSDMLKAFSE